MLRAQSLWRNVWCSSRHCLNSRGNLGCSGHHNLVACVPARVRGPFLSRSCQPARAGGTLHVFRHPHRHGFELLCCSKITACGRVALLADILLLRARRSGLLTAWDHPLSFVDQAVKPCQMSNKVCLVVISLHRTWSMLLEPCNHFSTPARSGAEA